MQRLSRREFLGAGAAGATLALGLDRLSWALPARARAAGVPAPGYRDYRDVYRWRWRWDRVVRGTHTNSSLMSLHRM